MFENLNMAAMERDYEDRCYRAYYGRDWWGNPVDDDSEAKFQAECERYDV